MFPSEILLSFGINLFALFELKQGFEAFVFQFVIGFLLHYIDTVLLETLIIL